MPKFNILQREGSEITLQVWCPMHNGYGPNIKAKNTDLLNWQGGQLVQIAFPYLSAEEREMLISGTCKECWDKMFTPDEKEGDSEESDEAEADAIVALMRSKGFSLVNTGGNCMAFLKKYPHDNHIKLVTHEYGHCVPEKWTDKVSIGVYASSSDFDNGIAEEREYPSIRAFLLDEE